MFFSPEVTFLPFCLFSICLMELGKKVFINPVFKHIPWCFPTSRSFYDLWMPLFDLIWFFFFFVVWDLVLRQGLVLRHHIDQMSLKFPEIPLPLQLLKMWGTTSSPLDSFSRQRASKKAITTWGHYQEVTLSISAWLWVHF